MGRKKPRIEAGFVLFDVLYQDGTRSSRRRIPAAEAGGLEGEARTRTLIMDQDRKIAQMSGNDRGPIESIIRSPGQ